MEEDEDCEIIEMYGEKAPEKFVAPMNRASDKMVANFLNVTRKFTETLEDMRKQELMQSCLKTSRKSLDFDDVHTPSRVRRQQPAPPRKPAQLSDKGHVKHQLSAAGPFTVPFFNTWRCRADWLSVAGESSEDVERWRPVRKYCTDARAEMNMHDIVDDFYQRATDFMHHGGLSMDEDYVGKPQDIYLWCFISESKKAGVWGCPMRFTSGYCAGIRIKEKGRYLTLEFCGKHHPR
jgi:hypothetical protein